MFTRRSSGRGTDAGALLIIGTLFALWHPGVSRAEQRLPQSTGFIPIDSASLLTPMAPDTNLLSDVPHPKLPFNGSPNRELAIRQGGDTFDDAFVISALPFVDSGTTAGYTNDYYAWCICWRGDWCIQSPDVVYAFTPTENVVIDVTLCGSSYDTYLHVFYTSESNYLCNDDYCGEASGLESITCFAGATYYIVVDGVWGSYGDYQISVAEHPPCTLTCPSEAISEGEVCSSGGRDTINGGCNAFPPVYITIDSGDTICGTSYSSISRRDTDWYRKSFTSNTTATFTVVASFPVKIAVASLARGCPANPTRYAEDRSCDTVSITADLAPGDYAFVVMPSVFSDFYRCEDGPWDYVAWLSCQPGPPAQPNDLCANATPIGEVIDLPFTLIGATDDGTSSCWSGNPNIWYCFTAPSTGLARFRICSSPRGSLLSVYDGCNCPPGEPVLCTSYLCDSYYQRTLPVTAGHSYLLEIESPVSGLERQSSGLLTVECFPFPAESYCETVTPVSLPAEFRFTYPVAAAQCEQFAGGHVWIAFTLDTCSDVTIDFCGSVGSFGNAWLNLVTGCPCGVISPAGNYKWCQVGYNYSPVIRWRGIPPGTYYYPVKYEGLYQRTIVVKVNSVPAPCRPCWAQGNCFEYIANVKVGSIDQSSECTKYADYTSVNTEMWKRLPYEILVTNGYPYSGTQCAVWVDWDKDNDFDRPEETVVMHGQYGPVQYYGTVIPPDSYGIDTVLMRVRLLYQNDIIPLQPCENSAYGEVEDYSLIVKHFECGDWNGDGIVNIADITAIVDYYFNSGPCAVPCAASDATCDDVANLADIISLANYVTATGPPPCCAQ